MNKNIEVLRFSEKSVPTAKGGYDQGTLSYVDLDTGKTEGKTLLSFTFPDVYKTLKEASTGTFFSVESEKLPGKDGKEYWNWTKISKMDTPPEKKEVSRVPVKPTYETPTERAQRQIYIIKQSSIASAVDLLKDHGKQPDVDKVLEVAARFVDFVLDSDEQII